VKSYHNTERKCWGEPLPIRYERSPHSPLLFKQELEKYVALIAGRAYFKEALQIQPRPTANAGICVVNACVADGISRQLKLLLRQRQRLAVRCAPYRAGRTGAAMPYPSRQHDKIKKSQRMSERPVRSDEISATEEFQQA